MLKVGLIGCGGMGSFHAACYGALRDRVELVAIADLDESKSKAATEKFGGKIYSSAQELIDNAEVDIIDICLPTYLHTEYAVKAMEKGCHVFLEKPVCLNLEQAKMLLDAQERTGKKVQIGQVVRFFKEYKWVKEAYDNGTYGKVLSASFIRRSQKVTWGWENWYHKPECSGSMALDLHIHDVDFIRYLLGEPDEVCSSNATRSDDGVIQQIYTTYRFGDTIVTSEGCWDYPICFPFSAGFTVKFEKATVILANGVLTVYPESGEKFSPELSENFEGEVEGINLSGLGPYYDELEHFVNTVENDLPVTIAPLSEAVKSLELDFKEIALAGGIVKK